MNKKIIISVVALGLMAGGLAIASSVSARYGEGANKDQIAKQLSQKLNIDESKVTVALDEIHVQRQEERKAQMGSKLDGAVSDGVISAEQKQLILDKQNEFRNNQEQTKEQHRDEMQKWMSDNGIDHDKLKTYLGGGNGFGKGRGRQ